MMVKYKKGEILKFTHNKMYNGNLIMIVTCESPLMSSSVADTYLYKVKILKDDSGNWEAGSEQQFVLNGKDDVDVLSQREAILEVL